MIFTPFLKAKWMRKMTPKLQTEMITAVVLAAQDYFQCTVFLLFLNCSEMLKVAPKVTNIFHNVLNKLLLRRN